MVFASLLSGMETGSFPWFLLTAVGVLLSVVLPYLCGSLNFAIILSDRFYHDDVRTHGSGNAGGTNMLRTYGKKAALLTILFDMLKALVGMGIGYLLFPFGFGYMISGFFVILGHVFPIFYKFKGGKGVSSVAMVVLLMSPASFAILFLTFVLIVVLSRFVSLGSVMGMFLFPFVYNRVESFLVQLNVDGGAMTEADAVPYLQNIAVGTIVACMCAALVIYKHKDNIKRLREGKESKISFRKKENQP